MMRDMSGKQRMIWPALAGYLAGLVTAIVVAMLRSGSPDTGTTVPASDVPAPPASAAASAPPTASSSVPQHAAAPLSAEARERIAPLEAKLAADSGDLLSRKQLALVLLQNQQLMAAYEHAEKVLASHPDDPDGLYVHGVVRLAMGHAPRAIELLDRVLARYPNHALALKARAEAQRKIGDQTGAALTEARAREAAGGTATGGGSEVEQLLAAASDGSLLDMMRSSPATTTATVAASDGD